MAGLALARIGKPNEAPTLRSYREWMAEEIPFNAAQRSWERADVIICGTPEIPYNPATEIVVAPPAGRMLPLNTRLPGRQGAV